MVIENASQRGEARSATLPLPAVILEKVRPLIVERTQELHLYHVGTVALGVIHARGSHGQRARRYELQSIIVYFAKESIN